MRLKKMDFLDAPMELNNHPDNVREWLELVDEERGIRWHIDMTFMLSHYGCKFGSCPGTRPGVVDTPGLGGCCTEEVFISHDPVHPDGKSDPERIDHFIDELDESMWSPRLREEYERRGTWGVNLDGEEPQLGIVDGKCIFANDAPTKEGDPPIGCAFHHLAAAKGISHVETKPEVCWQVPFFVNPLSDGDDDEAEFAIRTLSASSRGDWGSPDYEHGGIRRAAEGDPDAIEEVTDPDFVTWWCIDTPDAYNADEPVYISAKNELQAILGKPLYKKLRKVAETWERRTLMPGEQLGGGAPTIATVKSLFKSIREHSRA